MSVVADCFTIGSVVACRTCYERVIEGEVVAFDAATKMLVLKCPSSSGEARLNDVNVVNLALVSDVQIKREPAPPPSRGLASSAASQEKHSLDLQRLDSRCRKRIEDKRRLVSALSCLDPEGQRLYLAIAKTIKDVSWSGQNIRVFDRVTIRPPYKLDNICGDPDSKEYLYIKKIVERYTKDPADE